MGAFLERLRGLSLAARTGFLTAIVLVLFTLAAPVAFFLGGTSGLWAAALAAGLCFLGAALALQIAHLLRGPEHVWQATLLGMGMRMGIPLAVGVACHFRGGVLADAGILYYLLAFYPITLTVETALSLPGGTPTSRAEDVSPIGVS